MEQDEEKGEGREKMRRRKVLADMQFTGMELEETNGTGVLAVFLANESIAELSLVYPSACIKN